MSAKWLWLCFLIPAFAEASIQYEPLSSPVRHELFFGVSAFPSLGKKIRMNARAFSFQHNMLLKETNSLFGESYKDIIMPGVQWGGSFFLYDEKPKKRNYGVCASGDTLSGHLGLSLSLFRKYFLSPFGSAGLSGSVCFFKSAAEMLAQKAVFSPYLSYGLFLSFKAFDRGAVYGLDQDYGLNDIGFKGECVHHFYSLGRKSGKKVQPVRFCLLGLQLSF